MLEKCLCGGNVRLVSINNRRYLGNKYRLLPFIRSIIDQNCPDMKSLADIFAGTGAVASLFPDRKIITNDLLYSNYQCHLTWFGSQKFSLEKIFDFIDFYNQSEPTEKNYMSENFSNSYFSEAVCRKIGFIREDIEQQFLAKKINLRERAVLITSLLYGMDKIANTCGHYDAWRQDVPFRDSLELRAPDISDTVSNRGNECYNEDANDLAEHIRADLVYIDPPYNSRQYGDAYHVLENVAKWEKPEVFGVGRKMDRGESKSRYCTREAPVAFENLIRNIRARYILVSYNNMAKNGDERSNAKISDDEITSILTEKGQLKIFSESYKAFTTGKSIRPENEERLFLVIVR
ncbi:MAG: DNA adenine methylase [Planctomycetia bacterium]|nr:DNA adenine methylase [Planctomycetia bacterium]